ncbi:phosphotransferase [Actinoplanes sp. NPDC049265]|uniref:phosphotransferase n=1 Tax=Actinoplanes sp. NPDC049265 TaxID=3363902 RepID=UPI003717BE80
MTGEPADDTLPRAAGVSGRDRLGDVPAGGRTVGDGGTVQRLDAEAVAARIADITGVRLVVEGPCPGGEVGAAYVCWPDGRRSVLSEGNARVAPLLDRARAAGVPTARQELTAHVDGRRVIVQQRLPGTPPATVDAALVRQLIDVNTRLAGLLSSAPSGPRPVDLHLSGDGPGFCLHQPLAGYGGRAARLLDHVHEVGAALPHITGDDLVHFDFHPRNVLVAGGRITGVVDWDGAARYDGTFDLVTLRFTLAREQPRLVAMVDEVLRGRDPARLRAYWAHMSLRQVDWSIRHHDSSTVEAWLDVTETHSLR